MAMDPQEKIARHRLSVLQLAVALGNVIAAGRQRGMTCMQLYDYKRPCDSKGLIGAQGSATERHDHPQTPPLDVFECILTLSLGHPAWNR
jgi:hypothetical protein